VERVPTGIQGLDEMLRGGFLPRSANLVEGAPGTGKTTLGMQFVYNGIVRYDQPGIIVTFEEFPELYYRDAASFGWDFRELERQGKLRVIMTSPEVTKEELEIVGGTIEEAVRSLGASRILVDSLSHFARLSTDPIELRSLQYAFINALKRLGLTSILTRESTTLLGPVEPPRDEAAFLADSYILLRYVEIESAVERALLVLKFRGSDHAKDIRRYIISGQGLEVQSKFEGQQGLMSGSPRRMADSFVEAFVRRER